MSTHTGFTAGRLCAFIDEWRKLTKDPELLDIVRGCHFDIRLTESDLRRLQSRTIRFNFSNLESEAIEKEIVELLQLGVIIKVDKNDNQVISPIFLREKKDGGYRMVLNLKMLNTYIPYIHFKMETFELALTLINSNMFLASVDLRHAYYSIKIAEEQRKYFCFVWKDQIYQFTCLVNGICDGPRLFTKLMKPVFAKLRGMGHIISGYIDDSLLAGSTHHSCSLNVRDTTNLMTKLGFTINEKKSVLIPTTRIEYLGYVIDTKEMIVCLPEAKGEKIMLACADLHAKTVATIREVAKVIGLLVASFSAVELGKLYYRHLECAKIQALRINKGDFDANLIVSDAMRSDLDWWVQNVRHQIRQIIKPPVQVCIYTDASQLGWGASFNNNTIGGRWSTIESSLHINALELKAIWLALKSYHREIQGQHVKVFCDNTTAVSYINEMGGIKSTVCNIITFDIWTWCIKRGIWLTCAHIAGSDNVAADAASRKFVDKHEWMLDKKIFEHLCRDFGKPELDLFASRLNTQLPLYCAWQPDPDAAFIDAFSIRWNLVNTVYLFPPFSLLGRCVQKIREEKAMGIVVAPFWKTQPWFASLMELLVDVPVLLPNKTNLLRLPSQQDQHPMIHKMRMMACKVSGNSFDNKAFLYKQPTSSCHHGSHLLENNMEYPSGGGFHTVVKGKLIPFRHL